MESGFVTFCAGSVLWRYVTINTITNITTTTTPTTIHIHIVVLVEEGGSVVGSSGLSVTGTSVVGISVTGASVGACSPMLYMTSPSLLNKMIKMNFFSSPFDDRITVYSLNDCKPVVEPEITPVEEFRVSEAGRSGVIR